MAADGSRRQKRREDEEDGSGCSYVVFRDVWLWKAPYREKHAA